MGEEDLHETEATQARDSADEALPVELVIVFISFSETEWRRGYGHRSSLCRNRTAKGP